MKYCVYLTTYFGNKLPLFYIGSTQTDKIKTKNYRGSVTSLRYKNVWEIEIKNNPHLFKTRIISFHDNRKEALEKEYKLQKILNVVKSELYINQSLASKNGFFGMDIKGKKMSNETKEKLRNANFGKKASAETKAKMSKASLGKFKSEEHRKNIKIARNNRTEISAEAHENLSKAKRKENNPNFGKRGEQTSMYGKHHSKESKDKIGKVTKGTKWWNNGVSSIRSHLCPGDQWVLGRLKKEARWWTNGIENKCTKDSPGDDWYLGRS